MGIGALEVVNWVLVQLALPCLPFLSSMQFSRCLRLRLIWRQLLHCRLARYYNAPLQTTESIGSSFNLGYFLFAEGPGWCMKGHLSDMTRTWKSISGGQEIARECRNSCTSNAQSSIKGIRGFEKVVSSSAGAPTSTLLLSGCTNSPRS